MKKKGFTLVELLAVIAILAILVIVAMPNVLGMFNQAKSSTFVTEVQEYLNAASTKFMTEALKPGNQGKALIFSSDTSITGATKLDMSGADKTYRIDMDRNGNVTKIVIFDENFCYEANLVTTVTNADKEFLKIDKTTVNVANVWERNAAATGGDTVNACTGTVKAQ